MSPVGVWTKRVRKWWPILLALALLAAGLGTWWRMGRLPPVGAQVGQRAPDFTLTTLDDQPVSLADFRGQVVLIEFWQSTCPDCLVSLPHVAELARSFQGRGLVVLGVNLDHDPQAAQAAVDQILSDVVGNGLNDGYLRIDGTGTAAPSDPDGLALKATLISRGWTVYTN